MKKIYKFLLLTIVASSTMFYSCETFDLENVTDPNALSPDQADASLLLNTIQLDYRSSMITFNNNGADMGRIDQFGSRNYFEGLGPGTLNNPWGDLYSGMIPDIANILELHAPPENDLSFHLGISYVMQAHMMMLLVDYLGDVVFSQANNPVDFPTPELDDDQDVYNAAIALLMEAKILLAAAPGSGTANDLYYGGDITKWIKFANTLLMRADLTTGNYQAVVNATNVLEGIGDDIAFLYGTNVLSPDTRHPDYESDYRSDGANIYQNNWLMDLMVGENGDEGPDADPRRRFYFFRQIWRTPGSYSLIEDVLGLIGDPGDILAFTADGNGEKLDCSLQEVPSHLQFTPDADIWCSNKLGYWGRSHGNDDGIPPDNFERTAVGVYPAGGSFDSTPDAFPWVGTGINIGQQVGLGSGGGGGGIEPIMLSSYVDFMKAEASLHLGDAAGAATYFEAGLIKSITKVMAFGALDGGADFSQAPDQDDVDDFIEDQLDAFNSAPATSGLDGTGFPIEKDKMDILSEQYFVALYGGAADAFNFIRRTGYPRTMSRNMDANPGPFPRTFLYPGDEIIANPNIRQRTDMNTQVFWDNGVTSPAN
jgi:hypothetical protein